MQIRINAVYEQLTKTRVAQEPKAPRTQFDPTPQQNHSLHQLDNWLDNRRLLNDRRRRPNPKGTEGPWSPTVRADYFIISSLRIKNSCHFNDLFIRDKFLQ